MNAASKTDGKRASGARNSARPLRELFRRRRRRHDPMLVLSMSMFNFVDGWARTFNPIKAHENGI